MKTVATADEVARELLIHAAVVEAKPRAVAGQVVNTDICHLEQDPTAIGEPTRDQILQYFLLAVDGDALADQIAEADVVQRPAEGEIDPVVEHCFALHAAADPGLDQEIARPLLDQTGADATLDVVAAAVLEHDRIDAFAVKKVREHQPGGPRPDDSDLRAHGHLPVRRSPDR